MKPKLFRLQKYKKFESNSQPDCVNLTYCHGCFDCKSTKNLRAIHNNVAKVLFQLGVVSTAKVQKIWEQFTTATPSFRSGTALFRLQKYKKFESNSQRSLYDGTIRYCCFDCKSTKNLRAIHNKKVLSLQRKQVVSTAKVQKIWEQFTTPSAKYYFS